MRYGLLFVLKTASAEATARHRGGCPAGLTLVELRNDCPRDTVCEYELQGLTGPGSKDAVAPKDVNSVMTSA